MLIDRATRFSGDSADLVILGCKNGYVLILALPAFSKKKILNQDITNVAGGVGEFGPPY